ncbi:hypothetical protein DFH07DRAFT_781707 [Mycena maculata]|uniref:Uncharacterized protein n=1 Tax=Mycena maculata TaxID=230809 RepID=A0AAD7HWZ9_9AGAR|nr:hypothetical protein DFH07DRAFT_781707 [Mycena maculata]
MIIHVDATRYGQIQASSATLMGSRDTMSSIQSFSNSKNINESAPQIFHGCESELEASALGIKLSLSLFTMITKHLSAKVGGLLVLDKFETPWESSETRSRVEEFLSVLEDLPQIALLVTMKGQECPLKIWWTHPH